MSTAVRVKSRALSLDWNHLSHGPELRLISAEARVRYTAVPTPPLTQGTAESSHRATQMASTYYTATACQQKSPRLFSFLACKFKRNEMGDWIENMHGTCFLWTYVSTVSVELFLEPLSPTVPNCLTSDRGNNCTGKKEYIFQQRT